jgi:hypothetical protein
MRVVNPSVAFLRATTGMRRDRRNELLDWGYAILYLSAGSMIYAVGTAFLPLHNGYCQSQELI